MARMIKHAFGALPTAIMALIVSAYLAFSLWPETWWLEYRSIRVFDSRHGEDVIMLVDRSIHRPVVANWTVIIRHATDKGVEIFCTEKGTSNYRIDAVLPDPLTLEWWASQRCGKLPEGKYVMTTIWSFKGYLGFEKQVVRDSNPFSVLPVE